MRCLIAERTISFLSSTKKSSWSIDRGINSSNALPELNHDRLRSVSAYDTAVDGLSVLEVEVEVVEEEEDA